MPARPLLVAALLAVAVAALVALPPAAAQATPKALVPSMSMSDKVTVVVTDIPASHTASITLTTVVKSGSGASATLTTDTTTKALTVTNTRALETLTLKNGLYWWTVSIAGATPSSFTGQLVVDNQMAQLSSALASIRSDLATIEKSLGTPTSGLAQNVSRLEARVREVANATADQTVLLGLLDKDLDQVRAAQEAAGTRLTALELSANTTVGHVQGIDGTQRVVARSASAAEAWGSTLVYLVGGVALLLVAGALVLWSTVHRRHQELMVLVLAFAQKSGLTADSPELQRALMLLQPRRREPLPLP